MLAISIQEILLVAFSGMVAVVLARRYRRPWLLGIPAQIAVISLGTPADLISTLLIAVPCSLLYGAGILSSRSEAESVPG